MSNFESLEVSLEVFSKSTFYGIRFFNMHDETEKDC